jgi:hypothetical protein
MPQVPVYSERQVRLAPLQPVAQATPDVSSGAKAVAQGLEAVGVAADRIDLRDTQIRASTVDKTITEEWLKWDAGPEGRSRYRGENADGYSAAAESWWEEAKKKHWQGLDPRAQALAAQSLGAKRTSALGNALQFQNAEKERHADDVFGADVLQTIRFALSSGDTAGAIEQIRGKVAVVGARKGWTTQQVQAEEAKQLSPMHIAVINQLMQRDPKAAELYFNAHKEQINPAAVGELGNKLNQVSAIGDGEAKATELWTAMVKPGDYKNPVDLFALEKAAREAFPNDPTRQRAAVQSLREMTAAWNKSQVEVAAGHTNTVYGLLDQGMPFSRVQASDAWNALPEQQQRAIRRELAQEAAVAESRAAARDARAAAAAQRAYTDDLRRERQNLLLNADKYLEYSDPTRLASMTRPQVQALRSEFGFEATKHLLDRFDVLQKPGKVVEARMDTDDFNAIADRMGLKPFDPKKNENERRELGTLKFRIEQMIDVAQANAKRPLTREEKNILMREEMARTVTVDPGMFSRPRQVPVIAMTPQQIRQVVIPPAEMSKVVEALRVMNLANPTDPRYAPTQENMRRLYLENRSRAAGLIGTEPR